MALLISASVSVAAECAVDPDECTLKKLCEVATTIDGGSTIWSTATGSAKHVTVAQSLGMECGVTPIVDLCDTDPSECKLSQICGKATTDNAGQVSWNDSAAAYVVLAKEYGLQCDVSEEAAAEEVIKDFRQAFTSESKLKRQQFQYALKELGYYSYGADGLWGQGTSSAFDKFVSGYGLKGKTEAQVFNSLLAKVDVPSSFAAPKKKVAKTPKNKADKNGLFPEYVCTTTKVVVNISSLEFIIKINRMGSTLVTPDGKVEKLNRKETNAALKDIALDNHTSTNLKFRDNKVINSSSINMPKLDEKETKEFLKSASAADKRKFERIMEQFMAPQKYYIKNNIVSWSHKLPKELLKELIIKAAATSSLDLTKNQYQSSATGGGMKIKLWANCDPS